MKGHIFKVIPIISAVVTRNISAYNRYDSQSSYHSQRVGLTNFVFTIWFTVCFRLTIRVMVDRLVCFLSLKIHFISQGRDILVRRKINISNSLTSSHLGAAPSLLITTIRVWGRRSPRGVTSPWPRVLAGWEARSILTRPGLQHQVELKTILWAYIFSSWRFCWWNKFVLLKTKHE